MLAKKILDRNNGSADEVVRKQVLVKASKCYVIAELFNNQLESLLPDRIFARVFLSLRTVLIHPVLNLDVWVHFSNELRVSKEFTLDHHYGKDPSRLELLLLRLLLCRCEHLIESIT